MNDMLVRHEISAMVVRHEILLVRHDILTVLVPREMICWCVMNLCWCVMNLTVLVCLAVSGDGRRREQCSESWLRLKQDRARHESKKRQNREAAKRYRDKAKQANFTMGAYSLHHAASLYGLYPTSASAAWPHTSPADDGQSQLKD